MQPVYGLHRLDHAVGNAPKMQPVLDYLSKMTGWHEFAEFTAEDVGTLDSGVQAVHFEILFTTPAQSTARIHHPCPVSKPKSGGFVK